MRRGSHEGDASDVCFLSPWCRLRLSWQDCTLILTEGDSAKTLAVSGLGVVGRDRYGVFPLKGKLLNVREASNPQVLKNEEIQVRNKWWKGSRIHGTW